MQDALAAIAALIQSTGIAVTDDTTGRAHALGAHRTGTLSIARYRGDGPALPGAVGPGQASALSVDLRYVGDPYLAEAEAVDDVQAVAEAICAQGVVEGVHVAPADGRLLDGEIVVLADLLTLRTSTAAGHLFDEAQHADAMLRLVNELGPTPAGPAADGVEPEPEGPALDVDNHRRIRRLPLRCRIDLHSGARWSDVRAQIRAAAQRAGLTWLGDNGRPSAELLDSHIDGACDMVLVSIAGGDVRLDGDALTARAEFMLHRSP